MKINFQGPLPNPARHNEQHKEQISDLFTYSVLTFSSFSVHFSFFFQILFHPQLSEETGFLFEFTLLRVLPFFSVCIKKKKFCFFSLSS